jgi:hypothetical protein
MIKKKKKDYADYLRLLICWPYHRNINYLGEPKLTEIEPFKAEFSSDWLQSKRDLK